MKNWFRYSEKVRNQIHHYLIQNQKDKEQIERLKEILDQRTKSENALATNQNILISFRSVVLDNAKQKPTPLIQNLKTKKKIRKIGIIQAAPLLAPPVIPRSMIPRLIPPSIPRSMSPLLIPRLIPPPLPPNIPPSIPPSSNVIHNNNGIHNNQHNHNNRNNVVGNNHHSNHNGFGQSGQVGVRSGIEMGFGEMVRNSGLVGSGVEQRKYGVLKEFL
jgi:hypothetical protein